MDPSSEKDSRVRKCKALEFSFRICHALLRALPVILIILFSILIVYEFFLPPLISLLIRSLPVLACTAVLLKLLLSSDHKRNNGRRNPGSLQRPHSVRRRANMRVENVPTTFDDLISRTSVFGETQRELLEDIASLEAELTGRSSSSLSSPGKARALDEGDTGLVSRNGYDEWFHKMDGPKGESDAESQEEEEPKEDEEEAQKDERTAVEWTEDDEKNLMDLGASEMERNRRLESLIAKRRARKLPKVQVGKNGIVPTNLIARTKPLNLSSNPGDTSPSPGSAPSVLLPNHNPFDLPYDSQEEKPNLTGGGFQEEFMEGCQKDFSYCRHESFSFGKSSSGDVRRMRQEKKFNPYSVAKKRPSAHSRLKSQPDKKDSKQSVKGQSSHGGALTSHTENALQTKNEMPAGSKKEGHGKSEHEGDDSDMSSSMLSSSEEDACNIDKGTTVTVHSPSPCAIGKTRDEVYFFFGDKRTGLTPTYSVASDLQVELGSTVDTSPRDGDSLMYDGDVEKGVSSGSEEMDGVSRENDDIGESGISGIDQNPNNSKEDTAINISSNEFSPEKLAPMLLLEAQRLESQRAQSSNVSEPEISQEPSSNYPGKPSEDNNELEVEKEHGMGLKYLEGNLCEPQILIKEEALMEPQEPGEGTKSSGNEDEAKTGPIRRTEENEDLATFRYSEDSRKLAQHEEANPAKPVISNVNAAALEGEEPFTLPSRISMEGSNIIYSNSEKMPEEEVVREPLQSKQTTNELDVKKDHGMGKSTEAKPGECQKLVKEEVLMEPPPRPDEGTKPSYNKDEAKIGPTRTTGENEDLETFKDSEESRKLVQHKEVVVNPSKPVISNDSVLALEREEPFTLPSRTSSNSKEMPVQEVAVEPLQSEKTTKELEVAKEHGMGLKSIEGNQVEPRALVNEEVIMEPSEPREGTKSSYKEDEVKTEPIRTGENEDLRTFKDSEDSRKLFQHEEDVVNPSKPVISNDNAASLGE